MENNLLGDRAAFSRLRYPLPADGGDDDRCPPGRRAVTTAGHHRADPDCGYDRDAGCPLFPVLGKDRSLSGLDGHHVDHRRGPARAGGGHAAGPDMAGHPPAPRRATREPGGAQPPTPPAPAPTVQSSPPPAPPSAAAGLEERTVVYTLQRAV